MPGDIVIWVLSYHGEPIAVSYRFECLNEFMANYTAAQQSDMAIKEVQVIR
jgi:hypothetical protein